MVLETEEKSYAFEDVFSKKQIEEIVKETVGEDNDFELVNGEVKCASADGIIGFLGEHLRAKIQVKVNGSVKNIHLFLKRMPVSASKAKFVEELNFFERESTVLNFIKKLEEPDGLHPWHTKAYICNETIVVMPDLAIDGYRICERQTTFDLQHMLVAITSLARFHAACANYETKRLIDGKRPYPILAEFGPVLNEVSFINSPWLDTVAILSLRVIEEFSEKFKNKKNELEEKLLKLFGNACDTLKETEGTVNVLLHKDLWNNNVMFKYNEGVPINALFVDFQCARYGPHTFDIMVLLYMNTCRSFREKYEGEILRHYFAKFLEAIDIATKERLQSLKYDYDEFRQWCDRSRMFGLLEAVALLPYTVMDSEAAQNSLDDPEKFVEYAQADRSKPVLAHARESKNFRERLLEVNEEFVERYM